jgi:tripeptide aminopeptidase
VDTVPTCAGAEPVIRGRYIRPKGKTGLGADDRAGVAGLLSGLAEVLAGGGDRPPITIAFLVCEELGLWGSRHIGPGVLRECAMGFNVDGGKPFEPTVGAPSGVLLDVEIDGIASHAGGRPERGASAATVFALAVAELAKGGWLGKVMKGRQEGRMNFGVVEGGSARNVVMPKMIVTGEARSYSEAFLQRIVVRADRTFARAARRVKNELGQTARARLRALRNYRWFKLAAGSAVMREYHRALEAVGAEPVAGALGFGAVDANNFCARGLPTVTFGAGGRDAHCVGESCYLPHYYQAVALLAELMRGP